MYASPLPILLLACICAIGATSTCAETISEKRLELLFRPPVAQQTALSTDGHYLAYTEHTGTDLNVVVLDLDLLQIKTRIIADDDRPIMFSNEKERSRLRFLAWANGHRLVFAPAIETVKPAARAPVVVASASPESDAFIREMVASMPPPPTTYLAPVMAVDADGRHPLDLDKKVLQELVGAGDMTSARRTAVAQLHGFGTGKQRDQLLVEVRSNQPGAPTELFQINVESGAHRSLHRESVAQGTLLYDWANQPRLNQFTPGRSYTTSFEYRAIDAKRWGAMPEPPGEDSGAHFTVSPENYFGPRVIALGFDFDPNVLLYASNVGRDTFGIYGMDLRTRQRTSLVLEVPHRDLVVLDTSMATSPLVFDAFREKLVGTRANFGPRPLTVWLDDDLAEIQRAVERRYPHRSVEVQQWNAARTRFIVRTSGGTDPGSIFLVRKPEGSMTELTRAAPWLAEGDLHDTRFFDFTAPSGAQLTGYLTLPRTPRINPPPLIIWFASGMPPQPHSEFDPQAQVLADMGFVVCRLNQRGVLGLGTEHLNALRRDLDHASADDAIAAVEWVAQHYHIDRKRVATLGEGFAGHLALRATQLYPQAFRCAAIFDPVIHFAPLVEMPPNLDLNALPTFRQQVNRAYLEGGRVKLSDLSVLAHADELNAPVFIATRTDLHEYLAAGVSDLRSQLKRRDIPSVSVTYNEDFTHGLPAARARLYRELEEFFNLNLYDYGVKIGPTKVMK
jgi:dipeptidyl aminopeptidase/acylaminoacyl peptidase